MQNDTRQIACLTNTQNDTKSANWQRCQNGYLVQVYNEVIRSGQRGLPR